MLASLKNPDPLSFLALYDANPSWRGELGSVVAHCIELLSTTGVNKNGDLAAFVFLGDLNNAEQLVIMPSKIHTWVGLLRDTFEMATFAVMSTTCLEFSRRPGQRCRCKGHKYDLKSMLETSYVPDQHTQVRRLFASMHINDRLKMQHSGKFKIKKRSSNGVLLGTWDIMRYALQPTYSREKYRERREEAEQAIRVFVLSKRRQALPRSKREKKSKSGLHSQHAGHDSTAVPTRESQSLPRSSQENPQSSNDLLIPSGAPMIEVDPLQNTSTASFLASVDESVTLSQTSKYMHSSTLMGSKDRLTPSLETPYGDRASFRTGSPFRVDKGIQTEPGQIPQASSKQSMSNGASHEGSEPIRLSSRVKGKERQHEIEVPPKIHQQPDDEDLLSPKTSETRHGQGRSGSRHNRSNKEDDTSPRSARHREKSDAETNGTDRSKHRRSRTSVEEINSSTRQNDVKRKLGLRYYD
ncbi:hypothetical protein MMC25_003685 [Agyrium rufum]|nr:hypothetical protein [Agyrium rufum]